MGAIGDALADDGQGSGVGVDLISGAGEGGEEAAAEAQKTQAIGAENPEARSPREKYRAAGFCPRELPGVRDIAQA